jgi:microcystin-dependent protein
VNSGGNHSHSFPATTSTTYQQANAARLNRGSVGVTTVTAPFGFYGGTSTHAHSASGVGTTGSSGTNANLPPYFALFYIMKGGE